MNNKQKEVANNINTVIKQLQSINVEDDGAADELRSSAAQLISASNKINK